MTTKTARLIVILTALSLLTFGVALAAKPVRVFIGGPLVVGDQVFSGGELEIIPRFEGRLFVLKLDGRQIALASPVGEKVRPGKVLVKVDPSGMWHLLGLRVEDSHPVMLAFDSVTEGLATLRTGPKADEGIASVQH